MAVGIRVLPRGHGKYNVFGTLLENVVAPTNGTWLRLDGKFPVTVTLEGNFLGTAKVFVSDQEEAPSNSDNDRPLMGEELTSTGSVLIDGPFLWVKAAILTQDSGTAHVYLFGLTEYL